MVDVQKAAQSIARLTLMKFFPQEKEARAALVQLVCGMAGSNEQVDWLVNRALVLYDDWPGPRELRALFCSRWKPRDGIEARSAIYIADESGGGFPSETARPAPALTPGKAEARQLLARVRDEFEPPKEKGRTEWREGQFAHRRALLPPIAQPITQADIDKAVAENRRKLAAGDGE